MEAKELIKKIFDLCQATPEYHEGKDATVEALRLDKTITEINSLCDIFLYDVGLPNSKMPD